MLVSSRQRLLLTASLAVAITAAAGTLGTAEGPRRTLATLASLGLGFGPGLLLGLVELALARSFGPWWQRSLTRLRLSRNLDPSRDAPREPVIGFHAAAFVLALALLVLALGIKLTLLRLRSVEDENLAENLAILSISGLTVFSAGLAGFVLPVARGLFERVDACIGLPRPASGRGRMLIWFALPVAIVSLLGLWRLEGALGLMAAPLWLGVAFALQLALTLLLGTQTKAPHLLLRALPFLLAALGFVGAHALLARSEGTAEALERSRPGGHLADGARLVTDFDGDGASAWFGGSDCAPFSAARGPYVRDRPGNRVDENCDGKDAVAGQTAALDTYFGKQPLRAGIRPDVVWFVIDALRADHTSLLGYRHATTPKLEELAREALVFSRAYSQSSATMLSFPSMLSGLDPGRLVWREEKGRLQLAEGQDFLSRRLEREGYRTGIVASPYMRERLPGLVRDWDWVGYLEEGVHNSASSASRAATFIVEAKKARKPFFLMVYLPAPHAPYSDHGKDIPRFPTRTAHYDEEIADADRHMGFVLDLLRSDKPRWTNTVVVVNGDHGEEFGEHGGTTHARTCHVESVHVPLVIRLPKQKKRRIDTNVALLDVVPTVLESIPLSKSSRPTLDGQSLLVPALAPERAPLERPIFCSVISQRVDQGEFLRRSVLSGRFKLMKELRGLQERALYDVEADPKERSPLPLDGQAKRKADELDAALSAQFTGNLHEANLHD